MFLSQESALPLRPMPLTQTMRVFYARALNSLVKTSFQNLRENCKASLRNSLAPYSFAWEINLGPGQFLKAARNPFLGLRPHWLRPPLLTERAGGVRTTWQREISNRSPAPQLNQQHESECYRNNKIPFINFLSPQLKSFRSHKVYIHQKTYNCPIRGFIQENTHSESHCLVPMPGA